MEKPDIADIFHPDGLVGPAVRMTPADQEPPAGRDACAVRPPTVVPPLQTRRMGMPPAVVRELGDERERLGRVGDLMVAGSLATDDYVRRVSDLDLVASRRRPGRREAKSGADHCSPASRRRERGGLRTRLCLRRRRHRRADRHAASDLDSWAAGAPRSLPTGVDVPAAARRVLAVSGLVDGGQAGESGDLQ
ncbi:hypothetical protein GCM10025331_68240 [Actinoplanes utahensis]|nr:hypothetical protein Aut01nite_00880 [Actinoplanes utahensis]